LTDSNANQISALYDLAMRVAFPILLGVCGWTFSTLWDHGNRITRIEASRYSREDAKADRDGLTNMLAALQVDLAVCRGSQEATAQRLSRIEDRIGQLVDVVHTLEARAMRNEDR